MESNTVLHVINSLGIGGAEILLLNTTKALPDYKHIVVATGNDNGKLKFPDNVQIIELGCRGWKDLFRAVRRLRQIINEKNPAIVHSHLYYSSLVAKLACAASTPLAISLHNEMSRDLYFNKWYSLYNLYIDRFTFKRWHKIIGVSRLVIEDYQKYISTQTENFVLYNFVSPVFFDKTKENYNLSGGAVRLVAVGNLREQKNHELILDALALEKEINIHVDIYGAGHLKEALQKKIDSFSLPVTLKGNDYQISEVLPQYDGFIMPSAYEGFGISVAEAMAAGLPLLLSDLPIFREVSNNNAIFFSPSEPGDLLQKMKYFTTLTPGQKQQAADRNKDTAQRQYSEDAFSKSLGDIYSSILKSSTGK